MQDCLIGDVRITICCKMKSQAFAMSAFLHEFRNSFLLHVATYIQALLSGFPFCSMRVLEPLENCASLSLIAFANRKYSDEPVLKCNQSM